MEKKRPPAILLAHNNTDYRRSLRDILELASYRVVEAKSVEQARHKLRIGTISLALIDLRLTDDDDPNDISGLEVAKFARANDIPCYILTAYQSVVAARLALGSSSGERPLAIDLIPKEEGPHEVLVAVRRVLTERAAPGHGIVVDSDRGLAFHKGAPLELSRQQYALLSHMYRKKSSVCSSEELLKVVYDEDVSPSEAILDKRLERLIARVREKIEVDPSNPHHLINVQGRGYLLEVNC